MENQNQANELSGKIRIPPTHSPTNAMSAGALKGICAHAVSNTLPGRVASIREFFFVASDRSLPKFGEYQGEMTRLGNSYLPCLSRATLTSRRLNG
jgi:hypothetical protein